MADVSLKRSLRQDMRARRAALTDDARAEAGRRIDQVVAACLASLGPANGRHVALFAPARTEAGVAVPENIRALGWTTAYPRVDGDSLVFVAVEDERALVRGHRGLLEPGAAGPIVAPASFGVVFVPGLAFDLRGGRLGQGGGHYDRFLATVRPEALRVGIAFACQLVAAVPADPWDIPMDRVVTELGLTTLRR